MRLFHMEIKEEKEVDSDCVCGQRWLLKKMIFQPNPEPSNHNRRCVCGA